MQNTSKAFILIFFYFIIETAGQDNCTEQISIFEGRLHLFDVGWKNMPSYHQFLPLGKQCASNYCGWNARFSCLTAGNTLRPVNCTYAQEHSMFPLCAGRAIVGGGCETWDCCHQLNRQVWSYLDNLWMSISVERNYLMLYFGNYDSIPIRCESYSPGVGPCLQYVEYYASSDWAACDALQNNFDKFYFNNKNNDVPTIWPSNYFKNDFTKFNLLAS